MMKETKSKTKKGNPIRTAIEVTDYHVIIKKCVYSKEPLRFFEVVHGYPVRFGRTLYIQIMVFSKEDFLLLYPLAIQSSLRI